MPTNFTWAMLLLVAGLIAIVAAQAAMKKTESRKTWTWIGVVVGAVGLIALSGYLPALDGLNQPIGGSVGTGAVVGSQTSQRPLATSGLCAVEDTTVTFTGIDKYTGLAVGGQHAYKVNNGPIRRVADAGTDTLSPGDNLKVLFGNASTSASYLSDIKEFTIDCGGTFEASDELGNNGTVTIEIFNEEGNLVDSSGENETLGAGDVVTLPTNVKGTFQTAPFTHGGVVIVEFNSSDYDDIIADYGGLKTGVPDFFTVSDTANTARAYTVPSFESNDILRGSITLDVDDSNNPGDTNDPVLRFYPSNAYTDEDQPGIAFVSPAVEDEDSARTYGHITSATLNVD